MGRPLRLVPLAELSSDTCFSPAGVVLGDELRISLRVFSSESFEFL
jgi:hypothetical protein